MNIKLDSTHIGMQVYNLGFDRSKYDKCTKLYASGDVEVKFVLSPKQHIGLKSVTILPSTNEVKVEFSAKILQEQYLDGINRNTLERVYSVLKEYIDCSFEELINAIVYRTDITENLYWCSREEKWSGIGCLRLGKSNTGFIVEDFTDKKESIIFRGRQTSYKNRQIYYDKEKELYMSKNKDIVIYEYNNGGESIYIKIRKINRNFRYFLPCKFEHIYSL